jgi:hypothetical protein
MSGKQRFQTAYKKQEDVRRRNKQRCTCLENLRNKSHLSSTWYPSGRAGVAGGACNLSSCLDVPHAVLHASRHVLMRILLLPSSRVCVQSACGRPAREVLTSPVLILSEEEKRRERERDCSLEWTVHHVRKSFLQDLLLRQRQDEGHRDYQARRS